MAIPDFQSVMLPLLQLMGDGQERATTDMRVALAQRFDVTPEELAQLLPSGTQRVFVNRVAWALSYLKRAGLLKSAKRGRYQATERGLAVLEDPPTKIDISFLGRFEEFAGFRTGSAGSESAGNVVDTASETPEEKLRGAHAELRRALEQELLDLVKSCSPGFFEHLVVEVLVAMGYGGSIQDAGQAVGRGRDEGIDGVIKEDRLGLDTIYLQAKRWEGTVGRPEIQKFAGALQGKKARKGVFITTSSFTSEAKKFVADLESRIVLIDGAQLALLMADHGVGVTTESTYAIRRIDQDYFPED